MSELSELGTDDLILRHGSDIYAVDNGEIDEPTYNMRLFALLAEARRRDAARAQHAPEPITQEALRAAGWQVNEDGYGTWTAFANVGRLALSVVSIQGAMSISLMASHSEVDLSHIRTMRDLSKLRELLTGAPLPGEGDSDD